MTAQDKSTAGNLEPGEVLLDRYVVEAQVAEGGMAAVHRVHDRRTGGKVALKVLYPFYSQNEVVRMRFLDEGRIQRYLDHPNIIDVYEIIEHPQLSILMEFIDGPTLEEYLVEQGPLDNQQLLELMLPVLSAVGFAHHKGVIHRDIKPSNILLEPTPAGMVPKIMDFGVAKVERGKDLTEAGTTVGTLHYMSPEQIVGSKDIDGRADIYSLGVTIYKLCTGDVPFNASTEFALMMAQVEARPTPPRELRPEVSEQLEQIILKALSKKPDGRFRSVKELTSALLELEDDRANLDQTDTDTAPIPAELLEYAMMADEIAVDRTGELDITRFQDLITTEREPPGDDAADTVDATMELDAKRLQEQILQDRLAGQESSADSTTTMPIERPEAADPVDSKERTQPFERPSTDDGEALPGDASSERQGLSQETTQRFQKDEVERSDEMSATPFESGKADPDQPLELSVGAFGADDSGERDRSIDSRDVTQKVGLKEPRREPRRARASSADSMTKRSRDDAKEQIQRIAKSKKNSASSLQRALLVVGVLTLVGLLAAIVWVLVTGS
ncbi:MAG: serine/threonine-protein kinase [Persicimonas sp.]